MRAMTDNKLNLFFYFQLKLLSDNENIDAI